MWRNYKIQMDVAKPGERHAQINMYYGTSWVWESVVAHTRNHGGKEHSWQGFPRKGRTLPWAETWVDGSENNRGHGAKFSQPPRWRSLQENLCVSLGKSRPWELVKYAVSPSPASSDFQKDRISLGKLGKTNTPNAGDKTEHKWQINKGWSIRWWEGVERKTQFPKGTLTARYNI